MTTMDDVRKMSRADRGLAIVSTTRTDGSVHSSLVNAGVLSHPVSGDEVVGFVVRGNAAKRTLFRHSGRAAIIFRSGWRWAGVEGAVDLIGPDDDMEAFAADRGPGLLRDVFSAAGGTHDDWDEYDRVMVAELRTAVLVTPSRVLGDV